MRKVRQYANYFPRFSFSSSKNCQKHKSELLNVLPLKHAHPFHLTSDILKLVVVKLCGLAMPASKSFGRADIVDFAILAHCTAVHSIEHIDRRWCCDQRTKREL